MATARAQRFAEQGKTVLFLCFNRQLADWLKAELPERYDKKITISTYHELCYDWCARAGIEWDRGLTSAAAEPGSAIGREQDHYWNDRVPEMLLQAIDKVPERFNAVIVDEGQDFRPNWWTTIELLNSEPNNGALYVFYDPAQNLRREEEPAFPELGQPYELPTNCRNTREIALKCSRIREVEIRVRPGAPQGIAPSWIHARSKEEQIRACFRQLSEWLVQGGLKYSQIALMCMGRPPASSLGGLTRLGNHPLIGTIAMGSLEQSLQTGNHLNRWRTGDAILVTSIRRFRGLESDAVIIFDLPLLTSADFPTRYMRDCEQPTVADLYVALSRGKHLAAVISFVPQPGQFG
ncbi:MAG: hypothetical protein ABSG65_07445 [Bryobacteraceae bacterium]